MKHPHMQRRAALATQTDDQIDSLLQADPEALHALGRQVQDLRAEVALLKARLAEAEDLADADVLAPVLNRRAFVRELERALATLDRYGGSGALVYFDLDDFKAVNDRFGHAAGDEALKAVAARLLARVRKSDVVGRLGGDEFAVLLDRTGPEAARAKAETLRRAIEAEPVRTAGVEIRLKASWGASELRPGVSAKQSMAEADAAMFLNKPARGGA
jgi:diguanylate cyclase (GGDEF)-like protein